RAVRDTLKATSRANGPNQKNAQDALICLAKLDREKFVVARVEDGASADLKPLEALEQLVARLGARRDLLILTNRRPFRIDLDRRVVQWVRQGKAVRSVRFAHLGDTQPKLLEDEVDVRNLSEPRPKFLRRWVRRLWYHVRPEPPQPSGRVVQIDPLELGDT